MYYEQELEKFRDVPEYHYSQWDDYHLPELSETTLHCSSLWKRVYSFRSGRPKNDSATAVVPGESLVNNSSPVTRGLDSYLASYKAAIQSLDDEAGQISGDSGYGAMDKGHSFASCKRRATVSSLRGNAEFTYRSDAGDQYLIKPFVTGVSVFPTPVYYKPGETWKFPIEVQNTIQKLAVSTIPDKIEGSLGQDLIDVAELPRLLRHLSSIGQELTEIRRNWQRLPVKVRHAIDICIRDRSKAPKWALRTAGSGYLEWMFVLQPYIEDMKTIIRFLSSTSSSLLNRYSFTKERVALKTSERSSSGSYYGGCRALRFNHTEDNTFSVHLAIGWVRRGPLPSDGTFATKAIEMNRKLGIWYPSLLWDLMPWTWLIDWCTHIGASLDGIYAVSNSDYRPAYAWATVRNTVRYRGQFEPFYNWDTWLQSNHFDVENSSLCRFPVQITGAVKPHLSELSDSQKSILAALGLSHTK